MPTLNSIEARITRLETLFENLGKQISRELEIGTKVHQDLTESIAKLTTVMARLDERQDKTDLKLAYALGAVAVIVMLFNLFAPVLRNLLSLPS